MNCRLLITFVYRVLILSGLWWLLVGTDGWAWCFGGPVVLMLASWRINAASDSTYGVRLWRLAGFALFFLWRTLVGSCDVAWRAMHVRLPIAPHIVTYPLRLPADGPARVFFSNCISLLPGTLSASWESDILRVHVLTAEPHAIEELRSLEWQVAMLFGIQLNDCREEAGE